MIKKILLTFLFSFLCFLGIDKVSAETQRIYMSYDSGLANIGSTHNFSTTPKIFTNRITYVELTSDYDMRSTLYVRYAFCSSDNLYSSSSKMKYINTNIKCVNNDKVGFLSFFTGAYNEDELIGHVVGTTDVVTYTYDTSFNLYGTTTGDFTLYGADVSRTLENFPSYDSNSDVLSELDSLQDYLEESLYELNGTSNNILYYIKKLYENITTCRDSYNLFNINGEQIFTTPNISIDGNKIIVDAINQNPLASVFNYIPVEVNEQYTISFDLLQGTSRIGFRAYDSSYNLVSFSIENLSYNSFYKGYFKDSNKVTFTVPNGVSYIAPMFFAMQGDFDNIYSNYQVQKGSVVTSFEPFGKEICKSKFDETNDAINESNKKLDETNNKLQQQQDFMNDDDTSGSSSEAQEFFEGFDTDTYGLTSIITAPLELIGNIAGSTCSPLPLEIPFVGGTFNLPCMSSIYKKHFGSFLSIYQTITFGIVSYWVCIRIFALVKDFKNPEHDEIEVMDL